MLTLKEILINNSSLKWYINPSKKNFDDLVDYVAIWKSNSDEPVWKISSGLWFGEEREQKSKTFKIDEIDNAIKYFETMIKNSKAM